MLYVEPKDHIDLMVPSLCTTEGYTIFLILLKTFKIHHLVMNFMDYNIPRYENWKNVELPYLGKRMHTLFARIYMTGQKRNESLTIIT